MWTRNSLEEATRKGREALEKASDTVHRAALAYARYQGHTDETDIDRQRAKAELDGLIDAITHDDFGIAGPEHPIALMRELATYKMERDRERNRGARIVLDAASVDDLER